MNEKELIEWFTHVAIYIYIFYIFSNVLFRMTLQLYFAPTHHDDEFLSSYLAINDILILMWWLNQMFHHILPPGGSSRASSPSLWRGSLRRSTEEVTSRLPSPWPTQTSCGSQVRQGEAQSIHWSIMDYVLFVYNIITKHMICLFLCVCVVSLSLCLCLSLSLCLCLSFSLSVCLYLSLCVCVCVSLSL